MQHRAITFLAAGALAMVTMAGTARADYNGIGIVVADTTAQSATLANFNAANTGTAAKVDFTVSGLNFDSRINSPTTFQVEGFLNSQGSLTGTPTYSNGLTSTTPIGGGGANPFFPGTPYGILFQFTGVATFVNGQSYTVAHDDGLQFYVGCTGAACTAANLVINEPGPTGPTTTPGTYSGPSGNQEFTFIYGECCSPPAVFQTTLVTTAAVPEPGSVLLLGTVVIGVAGLLRRRKVA